VFGKANQLANPDLDPAIRQKLSAQLVPAGVSDELKEKKLKLIKKDETSGEKVVVPIQPAEAATWAQIAFWDIIVFFGVLMVGFAYVWRRGDLDWVRAYAHHQEPPVEPEKPVEQTKVA
jgi:NADH-quinone oxidoreductase subunit A